MKRISILILALLLLVTAAGSVMSADPVVSLSYVEEVFTPQALASTTARLHGRLGRIYGDGFSGAVEALAEDRLAVQKALAGTPRKAAGVVLLKAGDVLTAAPGCKVTVKTGSVTAGTAGLINVSDGAAVPMGAELRAGKLHMAGGDAALTAVSAACELTVSGVYTLAPSDAPDYGSLALALKEMGLFQGTNFGFELMGGANRAQALVMFLRLLGLEDEAEAYAGPVPFSDVPAYYWAYRQIGYAYANGLTEGTGGGKFSPEREMTCQQYATFLLRALHYAEGEDFTYDTAVDDLTQLGLFSVRETASLAAGSFRRYQMVYLSYHGLFGVDQSAGNLLMDRLVADGAVRQSALSAGLCLPVGGRIS